MLSSAEAYKRIYGKMEDIDQMLVRMEDENLRQTVMDGIRGINALWYECLMGRQAAIAMQVDSLKLTIDLLREQESSVHPPI